MSKKKIIYFVLFISILFVGCNNELEDGNTGFDETAIPLKVTLGGFDDFEDVTPISRSGNEVTTFVQPLDGLVDTGIDVITTIELLPADKNVNTRAALNTNALFKVLTYNSNHDLMFDNTYQIMNNSVSLVSGEAPVLSAGDYKFVCYTYNRKDLPSLQNGLAEVFTWDDFATCVIEKRIDSSDNSIAIDFKRHCCYLTMAAVASGFSNNTVSFTGTGIGNAPKATFPISYSTSNSMELTKTDISTTHSCPESTTIVPDKRNLNISYGNLKIGGISYGNRELVVPVYFVRRGNYKITAHFKKKEDGITLGGLKWAFGNLKYVNGVYSFMDGQEKYTNNNYAWSAQANPDYFSWNTLTLTTTSLNNGDPCSKVAPEGTWRTPTRADFEKILSLPYVRGELNGVRGYYFGVSNVPTEADKAKTLFLPFNGLRSDTGTYMFNKGIGGDYWASTAQNSYGEYLKLYDDAEAPSVTIQDKNSGKSIRCVR